MDRGTQVVPRNNLVTHDYQQVNVAVWHRIATQHGTVKHNRLQSRTISLDQPGTRLFKKRGNI